MLKHIESLLEPDPRYEIMQRYEPIAGDMTPMEIGDMHRLVAPIELGEHVPAEVSHQFDLARIAFVYSWFTYELATLAEQQAYAVLEMALRRRAEAEAALPKRPGLTVLLKVATERGCPSFASASAISRHPGDRTRQLAQWRQARGREASPLPSCSDSPRAK